MIISEFCKYHMSMRVVKYNGIVEINMLYIAKQYPENNSCFVHMNCHWFTLDCKWLKDDVNCRDSSLKIPRSVKSAVCIFYVNLRKLCSFAIYNKAVFIAISVVTDPACKIKRKSFAVYNTVCTQTLIAVFAGL